MHPVFVAETIIQCVETRTFTASSTDYIIIKDVIETNLLGEQVGEHLDTLICSLMIIILRFVYDIKQRFSLLV